MKVVLHLGFPRTATTYLQEQIFTKLKHTKATQELKPYINYRAYKRLIISDEMYSWLPERHTLLEQLYQNYPRAKTILGTRNIEEIKHKLHDHLLTYGLPQTYKQWEKNQPKENDTYIEHVKQLYPDAYIYSFYEFKKDNDKIIQEICNYIDSEIPNYTNVLINPSQKIPLKKQLPYINTLIHSPHNPYGLIPKQFVTAYSYNEGIATLAIEHPAYNKVLRFKVRSD